MSGKRQRLPPDIIAARKQYKRALLTEDDVQEAGSFLRRLAELLANGRQEDRLVEAALLAAGVVAYARPFSGNHEAKDAVGSISSTILSQLDSSQTVLHKRLMALRHEEFAHSSAAAASIKVSVFPSKRDPAVDFVLPVWRPLREPLSLTEVESTLLLLRWMFAITVDFKMALQNRVKAYGAF